MREDRIEALKGIIRDLHAGADVGDLQRRFARLVRDVSSTEIAEMERRLIAEGMPEAEVKRLCDLHTRVVRDSLERQEPSRVAAGHPLDTLRRENEALGQVVRGLRATLEALGDGRDPAALEARRAELVSGLGKLGEVEKHYRRKEYQFFPALEKHGVVAPPKVMWAVHDDVRALLKKVRAGLVAPARGRPDTGSSATAPGADPATLVADLNELLRRVEEMFYKEEKILFPLCLEVLTEEDWAAVREGEGEFGYALVEPATDAGARATGAGPEAGSGPRAAEVGRTGEVRLDTGVLTAEQVRVMLAHLPVDVTFVDENDEVRYYSEGDRVFPRSPGVIGRKVQNCHPPKSVATVQRILDSFRAGAKDVAEFWLDVGGRFVHIRYFAMRDAAGKYRGTLEVVQDVTAVRALQGQRRLLDW